MASSWPRPWPRWRIVTQSQGGGGGELPRPRAKAAAASPRSDLRSRTHLEVLGSTGSRDGFGQTSTVAAPMRSGPAAASLRCAASPELLIYLKNDIGSNHVEFQSLAISRKSSSNCRSDYVIVRNHNNQKTAELK